MIPSSVLMHVSPPQVKSLVFDQSGTYLAVGGSDIRVYICKQWSEVLNFTGEEESLFFSLFLVCVIEFMSLLFKKSKQKKAPTTFFSLCRSHRIGDGSGFWRECSVLVFSRNGQKSQILQFVEKGGIRFVSLVYVTELTVAHSDLAYSSDF